MAPLADRQVERRIRRLEAAVQRLVVLLRAAGVDINPSDLDTAADTAEEEVQ